MGNGPDGTPHLGPTTDGEDDSDERTDNDDYRQSGVDEYDLEERDEESTEEDRSDTTAGGKGGGGKLVTRSSTEEQPSEGKEKETCSDSEDGESEELGQGSGEDENTVEQKAQIVIRSDPWDNIGWGLYPIRYQLKEEYGIQFQIEDQLVSVREFESSEEMAQKWERDSQRHQMPVNTSVWDSNSPQSTELSSRAYLAAREQNDALAEAYLRRLRIAAIVEGRNIENHKLLVNLAEEAGLDKCQFQDDWQNVEVSRSTREIQTPETTIHVDGETITHSGYLHVDDLRMMLDQTGLDSEEPQRLYDFVAEHGPVAVREVEQVYSLQEDQARRKLQNTDGVIPTQLGDTEFWVTR